LQKKFTVVYAVFYCVKHAPLSSAVKIIIEIINGALTPLTVLAVASFINGASAFVNGGDNFYSVLVPMILIAVFYAFSQASRIILRLADKKLEININENIRPMMIGKLTRTSYAHLETPGSQDLISRVSSAEAQFAGIFNGGLEILRIMIQATGVSFFLAAHIPWIIPIFMVCSVLIIVIANRGGRKIYEIFRVSSVLTRTHYYLSGILTGREAAAERALFGYADYINKKFSETHLKRSNMVTGAIAIEEAAIHSCGLIINIFVIAAMIFLLRAAGNGVLSHGLFVSLIGALIGLSKTITGTLSRLVQNATEYTEFMKDFTLFFEMPEDCILKNKTERAGAFVFESLVIENLRFRYSPESEYVLNGVNLKIEKGKSYSLVGVNGAGKTTLTKILLGLYREFEGNIFINDINIDEFNTKTLRSIFSAVFQDFAKYYIPLRDNITLGNERGDLENSLRLADLTTIIENLPNGIDTPMGKIFENGADISGGEWQRTAIARALYADTPFIILDEPAASLSPSAESGLYKRFTEIIKNKTPLLISHRLGSTKLSDIIFVLDGGAITETGSHAELMAKNGIYAKMFKSQKSWYDE